MTPVQFEFEGKMYEGQLQSISGAGGVYHLMIDNFYYGKLRKAQGQWVLDTNKGSQGMEVLADELGKFIEN